MQLAPFTLLRISGGAEWSKISGKLPQTLENLPRAEQPAMLQPDIVHERERRLHERLVGGPPFRPRRYATRVENSLTKINEAFIHACILPARSQIAPGVMAKSWMAK